MLPSAVTSVEAEPATPATPAQGIAFWFLTCSAGTEKQLCSLSQTVRDAKDRRIIQIVAKRAGPAAYLELIVPLGIAVAYGVNLELSDTTKVQAKLVDCESDGCRAVLALDANVLPQIKAAKMLAVKFQDSKSGKIVSISGSLKGFEQGLAMVLAAP
jgi:invasion protein IalB